MIIFQKKINCNFYLGKPSVKIRMCTTPVMEGRNASLECATTGIPVPSIAWIRASTREVVSYKKTLVIEAIQIILAATSVLLGIELVIAVFRAQSTYTVSNSVCLFSVSLVSG